MTDNRKTQIQRYIKISCHRFSLTSTEFLYQMGFATFMCSAVENKIKSTENCITFIQPLGHNEPPPLMSSC